MIFHGANLVPEGLEIGEVKLKESVDFQNELSLLYVIAYLDSSITLQGTTYNFTGGKYNGILNGILFIVGTASLINDILLDINVTQGLGDKIMTVFTIPRFACSYAIDNPTTGNDYAVLAGDTFEQEILKTFSQTPNSLDSYVPRNQKLRTYPYCYLGFSPQNGTNKIYRYEDFENGIPSFKMISELNQNPSVFFIPQNYRGITGDNVSECCSFGGYPTVSWKTDYFNSWVAQNSNLVRIDMEQHNYQTQIGNTKSLVSGLTSIINSASPEDGTIGLSGIGSTANSALSMAENTKNFDYYIQRQLAQIEQQKLLPDKGSIGSSNTTLLGYDKLKNIFNVYTIKRQFAERIDKYFDMFGYLTNLVKLPNLNNRPSWNYVKTVGANIIAEIPQQDLQLIKNIFDNGVTLWHNPTTFLDYSQNNR